MSAWIAALLSTGLVSVTPTGISGDADSGAIYDCSHFCDAVFPWGRTLSADGRLVVFQSMADDLVPGDTNAAWDVFVRDLDLGVTRRISVDPAGGELSGSSFLPSISPNGRYVAFVSIAPDVVPGPTNGHAQVYLRDLLSGTTVRVSVDSNGNESDSDAGALWHAGQPMDYWAGAVSVSDDGRVAFLSRSSNLTQVLRSIGRPVLVQVFVHDVATGTTVCASVDSAGHEGNDWSAATFQHAVGPVYTGLSLSGDGRFVAFASQATNLDRHDADHGSDVYVRDLLAGSTTLVSVNALGKKGNNVSWMPSISYDGRYVAFESAADDLVPADTNGALDVFCRDLVGGGIVRVSVDSSGAQAALGAGQPEISARGRFVAFQSASGDLVGGDSNGITDIFVRDLQTGITSRRSLGARRDGLNSWCAAASLSDDARRVVFTTSISMTSSDTNGRWDVFVNE